jgi:hypothetical protein
LRPTTSRGLNGTIASARRITFEREELDDDDDTDDENAPVVGSPLSVADVRLLHAYNQRILGRFTLLNSIREAERKRALVALRRITEADKEISDIQNLSWRISLQLGRTELGDYIGL